MSASRLVVARIVAGLALLGVWQAVTSLGLINEIVARTPKEVAVFLYDIAVDGTLWPALWSTMSATLVALLLASVVGILLGLSLGLLPRVEAALDPYISAFNALPRIALAPVFIVYFGIGQSAKIALAFSLVVFILLINARAGVRSVDRDVLTMATAMDMSKPQLIWKVLLPNAVPSIFAGLRLGVIYSLLAVTGSELIAAKEGLGQLVASYSSTFQMEGTYAVLVVLAVIAAIINLVMERLERYLLRWQRR